MSARVLKAPEVVVSAEPDTATTDALREAAETAFDQGRRQGYREGSLALDEQVAALADALHSTGERVGREVADSLRLDASLVTRLAVDLASWFVGRTVDEAPDIVADGIVAELTTLAADDSIVLTVAPALAECLIGDGRLDGIAVRSDAALGPADFTITSSTTVIERRWREAMAEIAPDVSTALRFSDDDG